MNEDMQGGRKKGFVHTVSYYVKHMQTNCLFASICGGKKE